MRRGLHLKEIFANSLLTSLKYLIEVSQNAIDDTLLHKVSEKIDFLSINKNFSSFLSGYNHQLIKSIKENNISHVKSLFEAFYQENFDVDDKFVFYTPLNVYKKEMLKEIFSFELPTSVAFRDLLSADFDKTKKIIEQGLELLAKKLPNWYDEITTLVNEILILNTDNLRAGSSFDLFGLIYVNFNYKTENITDIISFIVHESAHLYIFLLSLNDQLVLNPPEERYQPPSSENVLRMDKRPIIGIFHATFVLARMIHVLGQLQDSKSFPNSEVDYCDSLIQAYKGRFLWGYETLMKHGKLTELGQMLITSSKSLLL